MSFKSILFLILALLASTNARDDTINNDSQAKLIDSTNSALGNQQARRNLRALKSIDDVRYLVLGFTVPFVNGIRNLDDSYSSLLTSDPSRMTRLDSMASNGPGYPSACLQTVISELDENQEFDVIILEYSTLQLQGLYELAGRLRQRYPDAILMFLDNWQPNHVSWFQDGVRVGNLRDWGESQSLTFGSDDFLDKIQDPNLDLRWQVAPMREQKLKAVAEDFGAIRVWIPPQTKVHSPVDTLLNYHKFYDGYEKEYMSAYAHRWLYQTIAEIVEEELRSYPAQPRIFGWGDGDECHTWFLSGETSLRYANVVDFERFAAPYAGHFYYALSTGLQHPNNEGYIIVENPFPTPRHLFLSYMGSGWASAMYSKTEIRVENYDATTKIVLDPRSNEFGENASHLILTSKVAVIPPGVSRVYWNLLQEEDRPTNRPFRLTAAMIVSTDVVEGGSMGPRADFTTDY